MSAGRSFRRAAALCCVIFTVGAAALCTSRTVSASSGAAWAVSEEYPAAPANAALSSITCPSANDCFVVGTEGPQGTDGVVLLTTDGGLSWTTQTLSSSQANSLSDIACTSTSDCLAVGDVGSVSTSAIILATSDGGSTWVGDTIPTGITRLTGIACSSTDDCVAVGYGAAPLTGVILVTSDGGASWSSASVPSGTSLINRVACPSTNDCFATSSSTSAPVLVSTDGGSTWSTQSFSDSAVNGVSGIDCPSTTQCFVAAHTNSGGVVEATTDGGSTWVTQTVPPTAVALSGVTCKSSTDCYAVGQSQNQPYVGIVDATTNGGTSWTSQSVSTASEDLTSVSCASDTCFAVGGGSVGGVILAYAPPRITTTSLPAGVVGSAYSGSVAATGGGPPYAWTISSGSLPPGLTLDTTTGAITGTPTVAGTFTPIFEATDSDGTTTTSTLPITVVPPSHGYWLVGSDGGIFSFGSAGFFGSTGSLHLQRPVVGISPTADRGGYWLVASDGGVFAFGDAGFVGSIPGLGLHPAGSGLSNSLNEPIIGMVPSRSGGGYFMVASDGGVFAFGDAKFEGSCPGIGGCAGSAVAVVPDATGNGYWVVTNTGNVYGFGDAGYFGAPGPQSSPMTSAVATPDGQGYWILEGNGHVFSYGDANGGFGSPSPTNFNELDPAVAIYATTDGGGYWVADAQGKVFDLGTAPFDGDTSGTHLNGAIVAANGY